MKLNDYLARRVDFMFSPWNELSFAMLYFTGSKNFNTAIRTRANEFGLSLNEHKFTILNNTKSNKLGPMPEIFPDEKSIFERKIVLVS